MNIYQPKRHEGSHFFYGALIAALTLWLGPHVALLIVAVVAIGKEAVDPYVGGTRDPLDIAWTIGGGLVVVVNEGVRLWMFG